MALHLRIEHDRGSGCVYVHLGSGEYAWTERLDQERAIDWDRAGEPLGLDFMNAAAGVDLSGIPYADEVAEALKRRGIRVREPAVAGAAE
jgi:hypothetical protein